MERFSFVFLIGGLGFFVLAFVVSGVVPYAQFHGVKVQTVAQLATPVPQDFVELRDDYPEAFKKAFGDVKIEDALADALVEGRQVYVGEACWHCHSQQVRPWGGDEARFGRVSQPLEYNNDLNYPVLWGTRRIGPDLIRESGRHSNDWHVAHFWKPTDTAPLSVMPGYPWLFEKDGKTPNRKGLSLIAYVQWLGSWEQGLQENVYGAKAIDRRFPMAAPAVPTPEAAPAGKPAAEESEY